MLEKFKNIYSEEAQNILKKEGFSIVKDSKYFRYSYNLILDDDTNIDLHILDVNNPQIYYKELLNDELQYIKNKFNTTIMDYIINNDIIKLDDCDEYLKDYLEIIVNTQLEIKCDQLERSLSLVG